MLLFHRGIEFLEVLRLSRIEKCCCSIEEGSSLKSCDYLESRMFFLYGFSWWLVKFVLAMLIGGNFI